MSDEGEDDRRVTRRSNDECRRIANDTKRYYGTDRLWPVNVGRILRSGKVLTLHGERPLIYECVDDRALGNKDAKTELVDGSIKITIKKSIDSLSTWGDGRARMTQAHELGHAVMHAADGFIDHRASGAAGTTTLSKINASESAEHQAKVFAAAFLINERRASELESPLDIATEFLVSLSAAEICFERILDERDRAAAVKRVLESNREFQAQMRQVAKPAKKYLLARCPACMHRTLVPLGIKVVCDNSGCGYVGDDPENGDQ
ncbi:ImmA/IrrE family metallo-endopeptidase [Bradyrhizobium sp. ma5]|uniref:ImmA/IrrE family metallo-endopeptidase n=1 Tax=Bradyrhizobium sp. ma5 TaxID=3344828 RepID=UPI0035D4527B